MSEAVHGEQCCFCGGDKFACLYHIQDHRIVRCTSCGLVRLYPMGSDVERASLYSERYYESASPTECGYGGYGSARDLYLRTARKRIRAIERHSKGGRLLDVGCGFGYFLEVAQGSFDECWGVDISGHAAEAVRQKGICCHQGDLAAAQFADRYFDVVVMEDLLEHVSSCGALLSEVRRILRDDGLLAITTPNIRSWLATISRDRWVSFKIPEHVVYYSPATIGRVLATNGFHTTEIRPAQQHCSLGFLAQRIRKLNAGAGSALQCIVERLGMGELSLNVPCGSMSVFAKKIVTPSKEGTRG